MKIRNLLIAILVILCIGLISCDGDAPESESSSQEHIHSYTDTQVAPTCTEQGYTLKKCECGDEVKLDIVNALGHTLGSWVTVTQPTCTLDGEMELSCTACQEVVEKKAKPKLSHYAVTTTVVAPTCTENGYTTHLCKVCGYSYNDSFVQKKNHKESEVVIKEATCKQTGEIEYRCEYCDILIRKQTVGIKGCNYVAYSVEANGTTEAHTLYACAGCGDSYTGAYLPSEVLSQANAKEIYNKTRDAIVEIIAYDKAGKSTTIGSGFFISEDGCIVTNYHVVQGAYSLSIFKYSTQTSTKSVKIVAYDAEQDVAILKMDTTGEKYLELATDAPTAGDTVYALGSTLGLTDTFTSGIVSTADRYIDDKHCIQFTAPISGGNSGGPLLNSEGKVVGVVTLTITNGQNINFAIKASTVEAVNAQKTNTPLDISTFYANTLEENALYVVKSYIMNNHMSCDGSAYYIYEVDSTYAREYYFIYDSVTDEVYLQIAVIDTSTGMDRLAITILLDDDNDGYFHVSVYDYAYSQTTMSGHVDHTAVINSMGSTFNENYFDAVFPELGSKYVDSDMEENVKAVLYHSYSVIISKFATLLSDSETGVDADMLNISVP